MRVDEQHVVTPAGIILWDGITTPETKDDGVIVHSLKVAIPVNDPEKADLEALAQDTLNASEFKGTMPAGGEYPIRQIDLTKFEADAALLTGRVAISANTRLGVPAVFDANGNELPAMQFGRLIYAGAVVKLMVHCYAFNNKSKGLAYGLDGIQIIDGSAPRLSVTGGISKDAVKAAFGGGGMPPATGGPAAPEPAPDFVANAGRRMTAKAAGATYEQFTAKGWTDEMLIAQGYMEA